MMNSLSYNSSSNYSSWEEKAFAEDIISVHDRPDESLIGGCVWPPRSYSCTFCKRDFSSAQALGGHMNLHRRDKARLKLNNNNLATDHNNHTNILIPNSLIPSTSKTQPPLRNIDHSRVSILVSSSSSYLSGFENKLQDDHSMHEVVLINGENRVETDFTDHHQLSGEIGIIDDIHEKRNCKRPKLFYFFLKPNCHLQSEVNNIHEVVKANTIIANSNNMDDLDLELRLGLP